MKSNIQDVSAVKKKLMIEIETEEVDKRVKDAFRKFGKKAKVKGFRPGKVPQKILERYFGEQILEDVTNSLIQETLPAAMEENETYPLNMPVIENEILKTGQDYHYSALFEVRPVFELNDYLGIEVEKEKYSVDEDLIDKQLEDIREARGNLQSIEEDRGIKEGDVAVIDYEAFDGVTPLEDIKADNYSLRIGKQQFYPGFEEALTGIKKGDTTEVEIEFKDDYFHSKLAGKKILFKVGVKDIKVAELPELNDEFVKGLGAEFESVEQLKEKIKEDLISREEKRVEDELKERLLNRISESVTFELPESLVETEINASLTSIKQNLAKAGSNFEASGLDEERLKEEIKPAAEKRVKNVLILGEIANKNDLRVDEADLTESFDNMSKSMGTDKETIRKYYEANNLMDAFRQTLLKEKTLKYLVENAKVTELEADKIKAKEEAGNS